MPSSRDILYTKSPRGGEKLGLTGAGDYAILASMKIGCHLSASGGYLAMAQTAVSFGANVFQFFTHAPYTLNAAGAETRVREFAESVMADDLERLEHTPGAMYNFHPGSHVGQGAEAGIGLISSMLSRILSKKPFRTTVLLETMSGKGSEVGRNFEEIRAIIDATDAPLGVCLDTCHVWDGGYDIVNNLDGTALSVLTG